ncbi:hypothetical protein QNI19_02435 [Cytophagaceae bacterium DM2B3-1]|uniref:Outer membrane protein beta-barrel domain-containing protein n=2 Tax=Xanthocytophaga TaxID=3078918 RepID=A0ABT7CDH7_9BACT|nr:MULTISPECIES: hypothetical protein [Xanthocytophaga]MDJ1491771.1 hypothetical protein [Xanthocytophaga flavus]MDJ1502854.1 hypothetical protein [Xanthocytophaga agilis]
MRKLTLVVLFLSTLYCVHAQVQDSASGRPILKKRTKPEDFWKKTFVAINLTPSLGSGSFGAYISPTFGYHPSENSSVAAGPLYMFNSFNNGTGSGRTTASIWGARVWGQHRIYRTFFAHAEYEVMNAVKMVVMNGLQYYYVNPDGSFSHQTIGNPLIGAAFVNEGDSGSQSFTILYNLNYIETATPYTKLFSIPIVLRASISFNLGGNR